MGALAIDFGMINADNVEQVRVSSVGNYRDQELI